MRINSDNPLWLLVDAAVRNELREELNFDNKGAIGGIIGFYIYGLEEFDLEVGAGCRLYFTINEIIIDIYDKEDILIDIDDIIGYKFFSTTDLIARKIDTEEFVADVKTICSSRERYFYLKAEDTEGNIKEIFFAVSEIGVAEQYDELFNREIKPAIKKHLNYVISVNKNKNFSKKLMHKLKEELRKDKAVGFFQVYSITQFEKDFLISDRIPGYVIINFDEILFYFNDYQREYIINLDDLVKYEFFSYFDIIRRKKYEEELETDLSRNKYPSMKFLYIQYESDFEYKNLLFNIEETNTNEYEKMKKHTESFLARRIIYNKSLNKKER